MKLFVSKGFIKTDRQTVLIDMLQAVKHGTKERYLCDTNKKKSLESSFPIKKNKLASATNK